MATQIGAIRVTIDSQNPKVQNISYGSRTLRGATDLVMGDPQTGDIISFDAANNNFIMTQPEEVIPHLDAGFY